MLTREQKVKALADIITATLIADPTFAIAYAAAGCVEDVSLLPDALNESRNAYVESRMFDRPVDGQPN